MRKTRSFAARWCRHGSPEGVGGLCRKIEEIARQVSGPVSGTRPCLQASRRDHVGLLVIAVIADVISASPVSNPSARLRFA